MCLLKCHYLLQQCFMQLLAACLLIMSTHTRASSQQTSTICWRHMSVSISHKAILEPFSGHLYPGRILGIIGPSGGPLCSSLLRHPPVQAAAKHL